MIKKILKVLGGLFLIAILLFGLLIFNTYKQFKKLQEGELQNTTVLDTIPFNYTNSGHILIETNIEGSEKIYPFILDSGAANLLFKKEKDEFNFESNGYAIGRGSTGNFFTARIKHIDSLNIGSLKFKNLNAKETKVNFNCMEDIYGLMGSSIMQHLVWQLDFKKKHIIVSKKLENLSFNDEAIEIPLIRDTNSNHLKIKLQFEKGKRSKHVILDLGSNSVLAVKENKILNDSLNLNYKTIDGKASNGIGGSSKSDIKEKIYLLKELYFNNTSFSVENIPVKTTPNGMNMLGLGFLKNYKTTISWADEKLILEPYETTQNFIWNTYGFKPSYDVELNKVIVKSIISDTEAYDSNIPLNAEIIKIDDHVFSDKNSFCEYSYLKEKDSIQLTIKKNNTIKVYNLVNKPVFTIE